MYKQTIRTRRDSFSANCISKHGLRRENAFKIVEKRQELHDKAYVRFGENARRGSDVSVIEFDEEAWVDKSRKIAFAGCKYISLYEKRYYYICFYNYTFNFLYNGHNSGAQNVLF